MLYQKFRPCAQLAPFVESYYVWTSKDEPVNNLVVESPPNGFCSIVFNTGDTYLLKNKKYAGFIVPRCFIAGQAIYSYSLSLTGVISIAGIVFKPAGLASLFHLPVYEFTEERMDLRKHTDPLLVTHIEEQLKALTDASDKAKLLEQFVLELCNNTIPVPDDIDIAANRIVELNGMLYVHDLLKDIYMSRRSFERKFFKKVGLSPKYYARIRRFSFLMNSIAGKKEADWVQLFSDCAYYDQSHFIKDFIAFTGRTPQQYLEANKELATMIQKPVTEPIQ